MKKYLSLYLLIITTSLFSVSLHAQGVAVNTDGSTADASAMLDVKSTSKGMLVPRVTSTASVTSPANGLLVYQINAPVGFYYYNGSVWIYLQNTGAVTGILKGTGTAVSAAVAGTDYLTPNGSAASLTGFPTLNQNTTGNAATVTTNANLTGDVTSSGNATTYNNVVPANKGGAGGNNGLLKANGSGTVSVATAGTDYLTPTGSAASLTGFPTLNQSTTGNAATVTTNANLTGAITSVGNTTSYNNIVPIAKGGTGTGTTPSLVAGSNVTISGTWPNQTIAAASGGGGSQAMYHQTLTSGSANSITITDLTIRTIIADFNGTAANAASIITYTLPAASSYTAGTIVVLDLIGYTGGAATPITFISPGSTFSAFNFNNSSTATGVSVGAAARFSVLSDGAGNHWYKIN